MIPRIVREATGSLLSRVPFLRGEHEGPHREVPMAEPFVDVDQAILSVEAPAPKSGSKCWWWDRQPGVRRQAPCESASTSRTSESLAHPVVELAPRPRGVRVSSRRASDCEPRRRSRERILLSGGEAADLEGPGLRDMKRDLNDGDVGVREEERAGPAP
jgi:hypothetical protein